MLQAVARPQRKSGHSRCILLPLGLLAMGMVAAQAQQAPADPSAAQSAAEPKSALVYDGDWWLLRGGQEQNGFIMGYQDCYISEYHGSTPFVKGPQSYADDVNKYFLADTTRGKQTVSEALDALRGGATDAPLPAYKAAMPPPADQPVYDGRFWSDADASVRLGFVEGYLACHTAKLKNADAKFSKSPSEYVERIEKDYGAAESTGEAQADKNNIRIASMLHRLKDPESPPAKPAS